MNRTLATGLCTLILLSCLSGAAIAQGEEKIYGVYIGGCLVMRLRTGAGVLQLPERREVIQQRLTDLMVATNTPRMDVDVLPASAAPVRTVQAGENYNVYANDMLM